MRKQFIIELTNWQGRYRWDKNGVTEIDFSFETDRDRVTIDYDILNSADIVYV